MSGVHGSPKIVVILVFGLPASGKTTFIKSIHDSIEKGEGFTCANGHSESSFICWKVILDEIIPGTNQKEAIESGNWKNVRGSFIQATSLLIDGIKTGHMYDDGDDFSASGCTAQAVSFYFMICERNNHQKIKFSRTCASQQTDHIILVEDNLYYKSMRYEWVKMCRRRSLALGAINCSSSLDQCLLRNSSRCHDDLIPEEIIRRMHQLFEPATNEEFYGHLIITDSLVDVGLSINMILSALDSPLEAPDNNEQQRESDRERTSVNVIHQLDQLMRKVIKDILCNGCPGKRDAAKTLSNRKYTILCEVKQGKLILPEWFINLLIKNDDDKKTSEMMSFAHDLLNK